MTVKRPDNRRSNQLREVQIFRDFIKYPEGSVLFCMGNTKVLCNVTVEEKIPSWMKYQGVKGGWISGEYSLLPRSTHTRTNRETSGLSGRTHEIKRLIGRSLRMAIDLDKLGPRTCTIDCDVIQADGGTRTAAITGGYIALALAIQKLAKQGLVPKDTLKTQVAAISVGIKNGKHLLDLCYEEDSEAEMDANVVMTAGGQLIEVQGTAEGKAFSKKDLDKLMTLAEGGIKDLLLLQRKCIQQGSRSRRS